MTWNYHCSSVIFNYLLIVSHIMTGDVLRLRITLGIISKIMILLIIDYQSLTLKIFSRVTWFWYYVLSHHSMWLPIWVLAVPLPNQFLASVPGEVAEDGQSACSPASLWETQRKPNLWPIPVPDSGCLENEVAHGKSLFLPLFFYGHLSSK